MHKIFKKKWDYIPASETHHPYQSFAMDDVLQEIVTNDGVPKARAWVHHPFVILGLHDARLPYLDDGLKFLRDKGYDYIVRNSGGLGVVLDEGVLNVSLIVPKSDAAMIDEGYEIMLDMVCRTFPDLDIKAYEITRSYCPGSYDLSIGGRKFAGISQRRVKGGVAVQIYLCVTGSGSERAEVMREFYHHARKNSDTKFHYPDISPEVMASINEITGAAFTVDEVLKGMLGVIEGGTEMMRAFTKEESERFEKSFKNMIKRNQNIRAEEDKILFSE